MIELISDYPGHHTTKHSQSSVVIGELSVKDFSEDCLQTAVLILLHKLSGQSSLSIDIISKTGIPACLSVEFESEDTAGQISRKKVVQTGKERSSSFGISYEAAETDMSALFQFVDNGLTISFNSSIYSGKTIREWGERLRIIATQLTREPGILLSDLDIFLPGEKETILHQWNPSAEDSAYYYRQIDYISEFEKQVENTPHRIAVLDAEKEWTYSQLNSYANVISGKLIEKGITTNQRIGLHVQRSAEMLGSMLGIMKAGGGYVPLEPGLPDDRMTYMATDSGISLAVSQKQFEDVPLLRDSLETIWIDGISADHYCSNPKRKCGPNDLAYVIYTSGSTGKPKGMEIEHHSMVNYVYANIERHEITEDDVYLGSTTIAFDVSVPELFCPLVIGARVHVAPPGIAADGEALGALLESAGITKMNATPTTFQILVSSGWKGKDDLVIMSGGEPINPELANKLQELCQQVYNEYGPCEATVFNTVHKIGEEAGIVPLGTPLLNSRLYVLDDHGNPVPPKVRGRIFIGGDCVVRGYINRPELNIEKFVSDPFSHTENARMYDTGDVGYWNDGYLYTLGRSDNQVKIRGYRIELGEIENAISGHPKISEAAVLVREDTPGQKRIVAYTRPVDEMPVSDELQEFLLATLPSYMVPTWFVEIAEFPKTVSGKIDRLSLPVPEVTVTDTEDTPTGNKLASDIAALWQEVLGVREVKTT
ncbi:MAG: amino acid adenylation domain-containing protein, partial [Verrucomicrobiales bacterium]|nr:amino acid adenylation domain-containing protein [Verrucomicrobiales bacterium]